MRYSEILESLTSTLPYEWKAKDLKSNSAYFRDYSRAEFTVDDRLVNVIFYKLDGGNGVEVIFTVDGVEDITGAGGSFEIFGTVMATIKEFVSDHPDLEFLIFAAPKNEPSRVKLYRTMARRLAGGWKVREVVERDDIEFQLTKS